MLTLCFLVFFKIRETKPPHVFFVKILWGGGVWHVVQHDVGSSLTVQQRRTLRPLALPRRFRAWLVAQHDVGRSFFTAQQRRPLHPLALEPKTNEWGVLSFLRRSNDDHPNHWPFQQAKKASTAQDIGRPHDSLAIPGLTSRSRRSATALADFPANILQTIKPRAMLLATHCALLVLTSLKGLQSAQLGPISEHTRKATSTLI